MNIVMILTSDNLVNQSRDGHISPLFKMHLHDECHEDYFLFCTIKCPHQLYVQLCIRAGEFPKKNFHHGRNRVFGPKNAPKKFESPTPNFPPPQFGK